MAINSNAVEPSALLNDKQWSPSSLRRQLEYEKCIAGCAKSLLCGQHSEDALAKALMHIVNGGDYRSGFIMKKHRHGDQKMVFDVIVKADARQPENAVTIHGNALEPSERLWSEVNANGMFSGTIQEWGLLTDEWPGTALESGACGFPIRVHGSVWGVLSVISETSGYRWKKDDLQLLNTAAEFFSVFFERHGAVTDHEEKNKLAGALEMAGVVCHKLNQPMQVILGYSSMVTSGDIKDPKQIIAIVKMVEDETRKMGIITKNLMGITKLGEAKAHHPG